MEMRPGPAGRFPLETIRSAGLERHGGVRLMRNFAARPALWDSAAILRRHRLRRGFRRGRLRRRPGDAVGRDAQLPSVIFEPNAEPGFTNRVLAKMSTRIATGYPSVAQRFGTRAVFHRLPRAPGIFRPSPRPAPLPPYRFLITGGSQGRRTSSIVAVRKRWVLLPQKDLLSRFHQTGERDYNAVHLAYTQNAASARRWLLSFPKWRSALPRPI
jgi:UDP-N-acetylglucosamine--N-acetylmuramyl-(pentapeptide) pyrophosphoryl-undecaprenol N-acetylglucosamine transferase